MTPKITLPTLTSIQFLDLAITSSNGSRGWPRTGIVPSFQPAPFDLDRLISPFNLSQPFGRHLFPSRLALDHISPKEAETANS